MSISERYRSAAHHLYDQAVVELEAGDLRQASEKFWGAAAQSMKALSERRGWRHRSHRHFHQTLDLINDEDDHEDIVRWFGLAESLHINFYEDRASYDTIRIISADVRKLVDRLDLID
ncbi:MAG: PaREP1 family protein [Chloroflexi bacterium]|nr:PaREP1 family protein [Chloroflexota bacterium]